MSLEDQVRKAMYADTYDEQSNLLQYVKENPQLFIDYATELLDHISPEVEAEARLVVREDWDSSYESLTESAISRDLYIDKRWREWIDVARARIAVRKFGDNSHG